MKNVRTFTILVAMTGWLISGPATASLVISEFMSINKSTVPDKDGDFRDWLEIYNSGDAVVNLAGWTLSDRRESSGWPAATPWPG